MRSGRPPAAGIAMVEDGTDASHLHLRRVAGRHLHCARNHRRAGAGRNRVDRRGRLRRHHPSARRRLADCRRHPGSHCRQYCRLLDRPEIRLFVAETIRQACRLERRSRQDRPMAVPALRRPLRIHRPLSALSPQHGGAAGRREPDAALSILYRQHRGGDVLGHDLRRGRLRVRRGLRRDGRPGGDRPHVRCGCDPRRVADADPALGEAPVGAGRA